MGKNRTRKVLDATIESGVAFAINGPAGAAPAAIAAIAKDTLSDLLNRHLSDRERARTERAFNQIKHIIEIRLNRHEQPRDDGFFGENRNDAIGNIDRADAAEILEGVLLKCQREHEQRKVQFIANIWANAAFDTVSLEFLNRLIRIAEQLTYRQLVIIALLKTQSNEGPGGTRELRVSKTSIEKQALIQDLVDLQSVGILVAESPAAPTLSQRGAMVQSLRSERSEKSWIISLSLSDIGMRLCQLMGLHGELDGIPKADLCKIERVLDDLWRHSSPVNPGPRNSRFRSSTIYLR